MELSKLKSLTAGGKIFSCKFVKRTDGTVRKMVARTGVAKDLSGEGRSWDPGERGLLPVYDMQAKAYRMIPAEGVIELKSGPRTYRAKNSSAF